jgi:hypothetical protein
MSQSDLLEFKATDIKEVEVVKEEKPKTKKEKKD